MNIGVNELEELGSTLRRLRSLMVIMVLVLATFAAATVYINSRNITPEGNSPPPPSQWTSDGEDYQLDLYNGNPINGTMALAEWSALIKNFTTSPTDFVQEYHWKVIKLAFAFQNLNDSGIIDTYYNQTDMDGVISYLYSQGFYVILSDQNWSGFGSHTWVEDWLGVAEHFKGDDRVLAYDLFNEPIPSSWSSNVTTEAYNSFQGIESAYSNLTALIQKIDPSRTVIWYAPYFDWTLDPSFERPDVVYDMHVYANVSGAHWTSNLIKTAELFDKIYGVTTVCLELNSEGSAGINFAQTESQIAMLEASHIAWTAWLFSEYPSYWIPILNNVSK